MRRWIWAVALVAAISVLAGCTNSPKQVKVEVSAMAFSTDRITLKQGVPVRLTLVNKDSVIHDLSVDEIPVLILAQPKESDDHQHDHQGKDPDLHVSAQPGKRGWVEFTPTVAGTYTFICTVPGHEAHGMRGTIVVTD